MYFHKITHPYNFIPWQNDDQQKALRIRDLGENVFHLTIADSSRWSGEQFESLVQESELNFTGNSDCSVLLEDTGAFTVRGENESILSTYAPFPFGVLMDSWVWCFALTETMKFYGMGEKNIGFEKSGLRTKFWNADVWADFSTEEINNGVTDPMYASFPVLIIRREASWIALIVPTASPVYMDTGARQVIEGVADSGAGEQFFYLGASGSSPELYAAVAHDPLVLAAKVQRLCTTVPRPPLWSLGYHQSRWGYSTCDHLFALDEKFREHKIPCDGLWIDIDYMEGYRVFSLNREDFPDLGKNLTKLKEQGRRVVPILDPGVKADHAFPPCKEGLEKGIFCKTAEGKPYVGFVWPGASYFPDFSKQEGIRWWAERSAALATEGFDGFWIDMNDPSTGSMEPEVMLFRDGRLPHAAYHNGYGLGMAQATYEGLSAANPGRRPFLLTRSAAIGSSRYGALWTGDNVSNYHHLRKGIEMVLSLSISGMPFVGSDVGGFGGDAEKKNYIDWFKASYLLPFMRNHSADGTRVQEPWTFDEEVLRIVKTCIRARYSLLPYLYQQFIRQELEGMPIIRPMIFQFPEDERFINEAEEFMIGDDILQAPNLYEESHEGKRTLLIPEGRWVDLYDGTWLTGPSLHEVQETPDSLHLFIRSGAVIPFIADAEIGDSTEDISNSRICFLIASDPECRSGTISRFIFDDGISYRYRDGEEEVITVEVASTESGLEISCSERERLFYIIGEMSTVAVNGNLIKTVPCRLPISGMKGTNTTVVDQ